MQSEGLRQDLRQRDARVAELEQRLLQTAGACRRCRGVHCWLKGDDANHLTMLLSCSQMPHTNPPPPHDKPQCGRDQPITALRSASAPLHLLLETLCRSASLSVLTLWRVVQV